MQKIITIRKEEMEFILDELWENEELQEAIEFYGEWNGIELDKVFNKVKSKIISLHLSESEKDND